MRRRALVAILILLLPLRLWASTCSIAHVGSDQVGNNGLIVAQVGSDQVGNNGAASCASSFTLSSRTVGAGNLLVLSIGSKGTTTPPTISTPSDNNSGSWSCTPYLGGVSSARFQSICIAPNHAAGATVVTVNYTGGSGTCNINAEMTEWANMGPTVTVDASAQNNGTGSTQSTGTTGTTVNVNEIAIAQDTAGNESVNPGSPTGGFTALTISHSGSGTTGITTATAFLTIGHTTTTGTSWFEGGGSSYVAQVVTLSGSNTCAGSFSLAPRTVGGSGSNLLVITAATNGIASPKATISSVTDNNGGSWTCNPFQFASTSSGTAVCWAQNHASGSTIATINYTGGTTQCDVVADLSEWTGPSSTVALDATATNFLASNSSPTTGTSGLTTANFELAVAIDETDTLGTIVVSGPNNGYTDLTQSNGTQHGNLISAYNILTFPQHTSTGWGLSAPTANVMQLVTLKGSGNVCATAQSWFEP